MESRFYRVTSDFDGVDTRDSRLGLGWAFHPGTVFGIVGVIGTPDNELMVQTLGTPDLVQIFESQLKGHAKMISEAQFLAETSDLHVPMWEDYAGPKDGMKLPWHMPDPAAIDDEMDPTLEREFEEFYQKAVKRAGQD